MRSHSSPKIPPLSETSEIPNVFRHPNSLSPSVRFPTSPSPPRWPCWRWAPPAASSAGGRGDADWRGDAKGELTCLERIKKYRSHIGSPTAGRANFSKATRNVQPGRPAVGPYPARAMRRVIVKTAPGPQAAGGPPEPPGSGGGGAASWTWKTRSTVPLKRQAGDEGHALLNVAFEALRS